MKSMVLSIAGPIASGKTTIALAVAAKLGWPYVSFGDYVRGEALTRGLDPNSRLELQRLGNELIDQGWEKFCSSVLSMAKWDRGKSLIIDGVRHTECLETIKTLVKPIDTYLIYIHIDDESRRLRILDRKIIDAEEIVQIDTHDTEIQVMSKLEPLGDLIINGSLSKENILGLIYNWMCELPTSNKEKS